MDKTLEQDTPVLVRADEGGIATLTLNRPDKYNALSVALLDALLDALTALEADGSVRVVVLAGAGKAFCAGHDLKEMRADSGAQAMRTLFDQCSQVMLALAKIPQPVIARVHGVAAAAGCQLVAACDLAIASERARFATSGVNLGLFCSTPAVALARNVSRKRAFEMLVTGDFIDARTACEYGLVNRVVAEDELDAATRELAEKIASKSRAALALGKQVFYRQLEAAAAAAYDVAGQAMVEGMQTEDARAGIDCFLGKKPMPQWQGK